MKNKIYFLFLWLCVGFSTGVGVLLYPVRIVTNYCRTNNFPALYEKISINLVIILYVILTFIFTLYLLKKVIKTDKRHFKIFTNIVCLVLLFLSVHLMMDPKNLNLDKGKETTVAQFTFGPYPDKGKLISLKTKNYTAIISLLHPAVVPFEPKLLNEEKQNCEGVGIKLISVPMLPWISKNEKAIETLKKLAENKNSKYYVHCYLGKDRVRIVSNMLKNMYGDKEIKVNLKEKGRRITDLKKFERGPYYKLEEDVYLTPYPTDDEFYGYILNGNFVSIINLLDVNNTDDLSWIQKEKDIASQYGLDFYNFPIKEDSIDDIIKKIETIKKPLLIHGFLTSSPLIKTFKQKYVQYVKNKKTHSGNVEKAVQESSEKFLPFIGKYIISYRLFAVLTPYFLIYIFLISNLCGYLRINKKVDVAYTRKIFHFCIIVFSGILQILFGVSAVILYGIYVSLSVLYAVYRKDDFPFYEAMARDSDRPKRSLFIIIPLITTGLGGIISNILFGQLAVIGYLTCGFGDAVAEPIGKKFGRHKFNVPSIAGVKAKRSIEGSTSVFLFSTFAAVLGFLGLGFSLLFAIKIGIIVGLVTTVVEIFSPHGMDNLFIQVFASATAFLL